MKIYKIKVFTTVLINDKNKGLSFYKVVLYKNLTLLNYFIKR